MPHTLEREQPMSFVNLTSDHYCTRCHNTTGSDSNVKRSHNLVDLLSWCQHCREVVEVTRCKVPYWTVLATAGISLFPMVVAP